MKTTTEREADVFFHTYKRLPLEIDHGEGVYLTMKDGKRYLDLFGGIAVNSLGYGHPAVLRAIREQSERYMHLSNYFIQEPQIRLAELLVRHSGFSKVFLTNSGTESIEGCFKVARKWGSTRGKNGIVSFSNAFHGRSMGALSIMDKPKYREGYGPFLDHCTVVAFNDPAALRGAVNDRTAAVFLEFIQGEGGICPATPELAAEIMSLKKKFGFLLVADEIQAGIGRTGKFFGFQHYNVRPDLVAVAKPVGGGLPLGAFLGTEEISAVLEPGVHGTTFGGNPVACAAGAALITELMEHGVMENAVKQGQFLKSELLNLQRQFPQLIREVRGFGLMIGVELTRDCDPVISMLREHQVLLNGTNGNVLRFLPPLVITEPELREGLEKLKAVFSALS